MASRDKSGRSYGTGRTRNYATVVYQESAPDNWQLILADLCISAFISPYHDMDKNPDGEPKKPHWHVMIMFDTVKTREQAREIFDKIGGVGCEVIASLRGYARYLCHLDNPDKHQYNKDDVTSLSGADYVRTIGLTSDKYIALDEMMEFCMVNNIYSYSELCNYARVNRPFDWFRVLSDCGTYMMSTFLRDRYFMRHEKTRPENIPVDYSPLYALLESKRMIKSKLTECISSATLARISKGLAVDMRTLNRICEFLDCQPGDVIAFMKEDPVSGEQEAAPAGADPLQPDVPDDASDVPDAAEFVPEPEPLPAAPRGEVTESVFKANRRMRRHQPKKPKGGGKT